MSIKIAELEYIEDATEVEVKALVSDKRLCFKKDGSAYVLMIIQDNTGTMSFPVWAYKNDTVDEIQTNTPIVVKGTLARYNGSLQLRNPNIKILREDILIDEFVPSYEIPEQLVNYFNNVVNSLAPKYKKIAVAATGFQGYDNQRWEAFINCVSAEKYHGNKRGGLFIHTIGVMKNVDGMLKNYISTPFYLSAKECVNKDRLMLKAILHDLMKIEEYDYSGIIRRKSIKMDHLVMGAAYVREINKEVGNVLDEDELDDICYSILCHHGQYGNYEMKTIEDILLNCADIIDSQIVNAIENKI